MANKKKKVELREEQRQNIVFYKDKQGRYTRCSKDFLDLMGVDEAHLIGADDFAFLDDKKARKYQEEDQKILSGISDKIIIEEINDDNTWVETVKIPIIQDDKITGLIGVVRDITKQKTVGKKDMHSHSFFKSILKSNPLPCVILDENDFIISANQVFLDFFPANISKNFMDMLLNNADQKLMKVDIRECFEQIKYKDEVKFLWYFKKDLDMIACEVVLSKIPVGAKVYLISTLNLVNELDLNRNYQQARAFLNVIPLPCIVFDRNMDIINVNSAAIELFEADNYEEVIANYYSYLPIIQPNGSNSKLSYLKHLHTAADVGKTEFKWEYRIKGNKIILAHISVNKIYVAGAERLISFISDLSREYALKEEVILSNQRSQILFDSCPLATCYFDDKMEFLDCNRELLKLFKVKNKEEYIRRYNSFFPIHQPNGQDSFQYFQDLRQMLLETGYLVYEWMYLASDGEQIPTKVVCVNYANEKGNIIISYIHDLRLLRDSLKKLNDLEKLASIDELTDIYNRRFFLESVAAKINSNEKKDYSIVIFDLDFFKRINDTYGHTIGDHVLKQVAGTIKQQLTSEMIFARYGGEEFILFMPNLNSKEALIVAQRITRAIEEMVFHIDDLLIKITLSAGVADNTDCHLLKHVIDEADKALYEAKNEGRNCVRIATPLEAIEQK